MPYPADHLSSDLGLAARLVGLTLGVRNLSQQGMFLVCGSLADRLGYKPMILTGLALRTVGFTLLGVADVLPVLVPASALTGLAGAFFNPAARAYLAQEAGERKVEACAAFNVFYQLGIMVGPLIGLLLGGIAFQLTCLVAAGLFAMLILAQASTRHGLGQGAVDTCAGARPRADADGAVLHPDGSGRRCEPGGHISAGRPGRLRGGHRAHPAEHWAAHAGDHGDLPVRDGHHRRARR
nr:MFS transporter [Actinomadura sp. RB99]